MKHEWIAAGRSLALRAADALKNHPRHVTALVVALMLGGGGAAFAVASLDIDPESVQVRQILESVSMPPIGDQIAALEVHSFNLFRSDVSRPHDSAETLLARLGIDDAAAVAYLRRDAAFRTHVLGRTGRSVTAEVSEDHDLRKLSVRWAPQDNGNFKRLVIERGEGDAFSSRVESAPLAPATRLGSGTVRSSLFAAADEARIPDSVVMQLVDIFGSNIDFHRSLQRGDRFSVVYKSLEADGEPLRAGRVLSAEFSNRGKLHQAVWFREAGQKGGYFDLDGKSMTSAFLASPMEFSRVTSGFSMRMHPILHRWKAHLGVDYGAATGTPVRSVGEGLVGFAGEQNGFGKVVIVKHNSTDETVYAHLSRIEVRQGQRIAQGQHLGAVGSTGWATGPHLHFEVRVNGVHRDPTRMARQGQTMPLTAQARPEFDKLVRSMRAQLAVAASSTLTASAN